MICQLGSSLLAQSVSSAATRQLSCDVSVQHSSAQLSSAQLSSAQLSSAQLSSAQLSSAQLRSAQLSSAQLSSAPLLFEGSVATRQLSCQVSCNLSAELHLVS